MHPPHTIKFSSSVTNWEQSSWLQKKVLRSIGGGSQCLMCKCHSNIEGAQCASRGQRQMRTHSKVHTPLYPFIIRLFLLVSSLVKMDRPWGS